MENTEKEFSNDKIIESIYGKRIDCQKPPIVRRVDLVRDIRNPEEVCVNGYQVDIVFNNEGRTIQECIQDILLKVYDS